MKILQLINGLAAGGAESFVANLSSAQRRLGHEVTVFTYAGVLDARGESLRAIMEAEGVQIVARNITKNGFKLALPLLLTHFIHEQQPDYVHVHLDQSAVFYYLSSLIRRHDAPSIQTLHNEKSIRTVPYRLLKATNGHFDINVACSQAVYEKYPRDLRGQAWAIIENGIRLREDASEDQKKVARQKLTFKDDCLYILNIGSMDKRFGEFQKGQDILIRALARLTQSLNIYVILLGDGQMRSELERLATDLRVSDRVLFMGSVVEPYDYIDAADLLVMPSRFEGLPIAAIESACAGLPLLVTEIEPFRCFSDKATLRVPANNPEALASAILKMKESLSHWKKKAREEIEAYHKKFDIMKVAQEYVGLHAQILSNRKGAALLRRRTSQIGSNL